MLRKVFPFWWWQPKPIEILHISYEYNKYEIRLLFPNIFNNMIYVNLNIFAITTRIAYYEILDAILAITSSRTCAFGVKSPTF